MSSVDRVAWPAAQIGPALLCLARRAGLRPRLLELAPPVAPDEERLTAWVEDAARAAGLDAELVDCAYADLRKSLAAGSLLAVLPDGRLVAVLGISGGQVVVVAPGDEQRRIGLGDLCAALAGAIESEAERELAGLARVCGDRVFARARSALQARLFGARRVMVGYAIGPAPGAPIPVQLAKAGVTRAVGLLAGLFAADTALGVLGWWLLGRVLLSGRLDPGWLLAWGLVLVTRLPVRFACARAQGRAVLRTGTTLRRRVMLGALRMPIDEIRRDGVGRLLGRCFEIEAVEGLAVGAGVHTLLAVIELLAAIVVLTFGVVPLLQIALVVGWALFIVLVSSSHYRRRRNWTELRIGLTHRLVEALIGHRTRLAQLPPEQLHANDDAHLETAWRAEAEMDRLGVALEAIPAHGPLVTGILAVCAGMLTGAPPTLLAVALGGVLLAHSGLRRLAHGITSLQGALLGWQQIRPICAAARDPEAPAPLSQPPHPAPGQALLNAQRVAFRHERRKADALSSLSLALVSGERVLLGGPSGCGKSTFAAIVAGVRSQTSGLVLLGGMDVRTLGAHAWRRLAVLIPQQHENHLVSGSLAFNLLLGRRWPPRPEHLDEAERVCSELGLADLLARMPGGLAQVVGETGWQLSHGEKSRVFLARALLQKPELLLADEILAALDPGTFRMATEAMLARSRTLVLIEHR